jgi:hypothetical protein
MDSHRQGYSGPHFIPGQACAACASRSYQTFALRREMSYLQYFGRLIALEAAPLLRAWFTWLRFNLFARLLLGCTALIAIATQLAIQVRSGFSILNFFSYFTNLSNAFAAIVLLLGASRVFFAGGRFRLDDQLRYVSVVNMAVVGVVFTMLLRGVDLGALLPWVNIVLHYVMPCAVVLDWLLQPPRVKLGLQQLAFCLIFPALYLVYVLYRGHLTGWYPYPFLNPVNVGGYAGVGAYAAGIGIAFFFASGLLLLAGNHLAKRASIDAA